MDRYRQHELPETVKRYKAYTDSFQEWLMRTAAQRGVENAVHIAEQAKKRKKGKGTYKMSTAQQTSLVDGIARSKEQLVDTSGLRDLEDAIRSRKEVAQFHKISGTPDDGHSFINLLLEAAKSKLTALVLSIPAGLKLQGLEDEASTFLVYRFADDETNESDDDNGADETQTEEVGKAPPQDDEKVHTSPQKKSTKDSLSQPETQLQRNFLVLCFLYEFNRVRGIVRETWLLYHKGSISIISAALVTDLAQSYVQQNVASLVEDLGSSKYAPNTGLLEILQQLYVGLSMSGIASTKSSTPLQLSDSALRHIFCMDAKEHLEAHLSHDPSTDDDASTSTDSKFPVKGFLRYFDAIRQKKITIPIWDRFTEAVIRSADLSDEYLPFGLQLVLDVHEIVYQDYQQIFMDVTNHGLDLAKLIRTHVDYEDKMWDMGKKPDYMSSGNVKFSNVYLTSLDSLLNWIQELLKVDKDSTSSTSMTTEEFITTHATLAGLSIWDFNKTYHGFSITKISWFVTNLAHLYNAALQVGELRHRWPDFDYIIQMHGSTRIFVGGPPKDPQDFLERFFMSTCTSSRVFAKDFRLSAKFLPLVSPEMRAKRGLMGHFPLEDAIRQYYGPNKDNNRWIRRHQVFNHLKQLSGTRPLKSQIENGEYTNASDLQELRATFSAIVKKLLPPKTKSRRNNSSRTRAPEFSQMDDTYANMFHAMRAELQAHELHGNFDYLAFYRSAYAIVLNIREKVLFDPAQQLARYGDIAEQQDPDNQNLLAELFRGLKIKPKDTKIEATGGEVSKDVVPLDQLKRIAGILGDVIQKEGSIELSRAKLRHKRDWDSLKASYAREEAREEQSFPTVNESQPHSRQPPTTPGDDGHHNPTVLTGGPSTIFNKTPPNVAGPSHIYEQGTGISSTSAEPFDLPKLNLPDKIEPFVIEDEYLRSFANFRDEYDPLPGNTQTNYRDIIDKLPEHVPAASAENKVNRFAQPGHQPSILSKTEFTFTAPNPVNRFPQPEYRVPMWPETEFTLTGSISIKVESKEEIGNESAVHSTQVFTELVDVPRKEHQAYVSDEAEEVDEGSGHELRAPASPPRASTDFNECADHMDTLRDICQAKQAASSAKNEVWRPNSVESIEDLETIMRICVADGSITAEDYNDPEKRHIFEEEYKETIEELVANGILIRGAEGVDHHEVDIPHSSATLKHNGKPKGVFHRLNYSSTSVRRRLITVTDKGKKARLTYTRRRRNRYFYLFSVARKRTVSFKCYAVCPLARALLGKKSTLQRHLQQATKILLAEDAAAPHDLQGACAVA